jgi:hypothetical protein
MKPSLVLCKQGVAGSIPATSTNLFNNLAQVLISSPAPL